MCGCVDSGVAGCVREASGAAGVCVCVARVVAECVRE